MCHIDDVLMWGKDQQDQGVRLHTVLRKLVKAALNMENCELSRSKVKSLGQILSARPRQRKAIMPMIELSTSGEVRCFLGMLNQQGKYIPGTSCTKSAYTKKFLHPF